MPIFANRRLSITLLLTVLGVAFLTYLPGLDGPFLFDDEPNILNNDEIPLDELSLQELKQGSLSGIAGPLKRPISMLTFSLNHYVSGFDPFAFKLVNLLIHLTTGASLYFLSLLLFNAFRRNINPELTQKHIQVVSLLVCAAWLLHPINLTSVLYVVQRMNSLSALFTVWGLICYLLGRSRLVAGQRGGTLLILLGTAVFGSLAVLSKENGLLLPGYMLVAELAVFRFRAYDRRSRAVVVGFFVAGIVTPAILAVAYLVVNPDWILSGYAHRDFGLLERMMTQARVLWFYIQLILLPNTSQMGLFHDYIPISRNLFNPVTTLPALLGIATIFGVALYSLKKAPILAFGLLFYLVGHAMESTVFALEIAHEHRNYLPGFGLLTALVYYVAHPRLVKPDLRSRVVLLGALVTLFAAVTFVRADSWSAERLYPLVEARNHPQSARANYELGRMYATAADVGPDQAEHFVLLATEQFTRTARSFEDNTNALFALIYLSERHSLAREDWWLDELVHRLKRPPFAANNINWISTLTACQFSGKCTLAPETMVRILRAASENPSLSNKQKAGLYAKTSEYWANALHDYETAIYLLAQANALTPNDVRFRIAFSRLLAMMGRLDDASEELRKAAASDAMGAYGPEIAGARKYISSRQTP